MLKYSRSIGFAFINLPRFFYKAFKEEKLILKQDKCQHSDLSLIESTMRGCEGKCKSP